MAKKTEESHWIKDTSDGLSKWETWFENWKKKFKRWAKSSYKRYTAEKY